MVFFIEYFKLCLVVFIALLIAVVLYQLNTLLLYNVKQKDVNQMSAYECGFQPFVESINKFDVRYYLVALLFILFDLEIMFLVP